MSGDRLKESLAMFRSALGKFEEVLQLPKSEVVRDSAIKRFEICFDLSWKTLKYFLEDVYKIICHSPRSCFRKAYQEGIIKEYDNFWMEIIEMRNIAVHSEEMAEKIYSELPKVLKYMKKLYTIISGEVGGEER